VGCYRKILVAVDGSADAAAALRHAGALARDQHAKLVVVTVIPPAPPQVASASAVAPSAAETDAAYERILRSAVDALPDDVGVVTRIARGRPAKAIAEVAAEIDCDLVVMGAHGHGRLHHALIGSTSGAVVRLVDRPVLLMRASCAKPAVDPASSAPVASGGSPREGLPWRDG
jgi:nucleotide-binding universal stress UspA family protein